MRLYRTQGDYYINLSNIILITPIEYHEPTNQYFYTIHLLSHNELRIAPPFDTKEEAEIDRSRLIYYTEDYR